MGDLKEGFNQVDNEEETRKKMAVLSAGGCWLPRGLTFGPTNGPEDFQELVFTVFQRRLYKDWYLFVDDLSVATGRKKCHGEGPSGAHDVSCSLRPETSGERASQCLSKESGQAFPSPFAHIGSRQVSQGAARHRPKAKRKLRFKVMSRTEETSKATYFRRSNLLMQIALLLASFVAASPRICRIAAFPWPGCCSSSDIAMDHDGSEDIREELPKPVSYTHLTLPTKA